jgi:hypothetical protein
VTDKLTPEEDAILRRLHWFEQMGIELSPERQALLSSIRERDKRSEIRDPGDEVVAEAAVDEEPDELPPVAIAPQELPPGAEGS